MRCGFGVPSPGVSQEYGDGVKGQALTKDHDSVTGRGGAYAQGFNLIWDLHFRASTLHRRSFDHGPDDYNPS